MGIEIAWENEINKQLEYIKTCSGQRKYVPMPSGDEYLVRSHAITTSVYLGVVNAHQHKQMMELERKYRNLSNITGGLQKALMQLLSEKQFNNIKITRPHNEPLNSSLARHWTDFLVDDLIAELENTGWLPNNTDYFSGDGETENYLYDKWRNTSDQVTACLHPSRLMTPNCWNNTMLKAIDFLTSVYIEGVSREIESPHRNTTYLYPT